MKIGEAKKNGADWARNFAESNEWVLGAYFSGSTIEKSDDEELPVGSDVDIVLVISLQDPPMKLGKFVYRGTLLEVTYLSQGELSSPEKVLSSYHLAGSFRVDTIIYDPDSVLKHLHQVVSAQFAQKRWVLKRCGDAGKRVGNGLASIRSEAPLHEQVMGFLFPSGVTTHILLVAALRNPTIRLRFAKAKEVLEHYGFHGIYEELLNLSGYSHFTPERVEYHLTQLEKTFDATVNVSKTPIFFSTDISVDSRPIVIEGSRHLISRGLHREAVFWIAATFTRCHTILAADASPDLHASLLPAFHELLDELELSSNSAITQKSQQVLDFLPVVWDTAEAIIHANPEIID
ncbi:hypothetical protein [Fictibacillus fluitans]|uniref:Polymerase nucleotidyl transferase domain-containing protein n=1 Tax=Fictibacillus fluitans TaxID=3058422 RepID=A0ABT8HZF6_9BACL|nr:hypothetical protein [Fictibacillus sp. NE201]MDN4526164.1 hypothetical protein [Fictibacillus sp. NE201]